MLKRLTLLWTVFRGDARQLWFALRHPAAPRWLKVGSAMIVLYVLSPIDIIPDVLPLIGIAEAGAWRTVSAPYRSTIERR